MTSSTYREFTVTLNRAHKISERMGGLMAEHRANANRRGNSIRVVAAMDSAQIERLHENAKSAAESLKKFELLARAQASVRASIGVANVASGISETLANIDANNKLISLFGAASEFGPAPDGYTAATIGNFKPTADKYGSDSVAVSAFTAAEAEAFQARKTELERETFALSDKLADLNAYKVTIRIPEELVTSLGLGSAN